MPPLLPDAMSAASSRLRAEDLPVAGMLFARVAVPEIAETLCLSENEVAGPSPAHHRRHAGHGRVAEPV